MTATKPNLTALILVGGTACARTTPSHDGVMSWIAVSSLPQNEFHAHDQGLKKLGDATNLRVAVFSFETNVPSADSGRDARMTLTKKRLVVVDNELGLDGSIAEAGRIMQSWGLDAEHLTDAALDDWFPRWLCSMLLRTSRFSDLPLWSDATINDTAYALLMDGRTVCAETAPAGESLRAWIGIEPDRSFRAPGPPSLRVFSFEVSAASIAAGYDVVGELVNQREAIICEEAGLDPSVKQAEAVLKLWGTNAARLISTDMDPDYPL